MGRTARELAPSSSDRTDGVPTMPKPNDLSRSRVAPRETTPPIAVIEVGLASWLIGGRVPGVNRSPLRKLDPDPEMLVARLHRWRDEAIQAGRTITRIAVAYEAGRDGFWLARWLRARGIETYVIHPTSIPVKRDHRRAKTDRLDTALLMRAFLGWLRGEADHCSMAAIPTLEEEDRKRPNREHQKLSGEKTRIISRVKGTLVRLGIRKFSGNLRYAADRLKQMRTPEGVAIPPNTMAELEHDLARLRFIREQARAIEKTRVTRLNQSPLDQPHAMVLLLAKVRGIGIETRRVPPRPLIRVELLCRGTRNSRATTLYSVGSRRPTTMMQSCASAAKLRGGGTILWNGNSQVPPRYTATSDHDRTFTCCWRMPILPRSNRPLLSSAGGTQHNTFGDFTDCRVTPQRYQQLARQGDNHCFSRAFRCVLGARLVPLRQCAVLLEHEPAPGELQHPSAHPRVAGLREAPFPSFRAALVRRSSHAGISCDGSAISQVSAKHLIDQHVSGLDTDASHLRQHQHHGMRLVQRRFIQPGHASFLDRARLFPDKPEPRKIPFQLRQGICRNGDALGRAHLFEPVRRISQ